MSYADGYSDALQGLEPQSDDPEYLLGYFSPESEADSGFASLPAELGA